MLDYLFRVFQKIKIFFYFFLFFYFYVYWHFRLGHPANDVVTRVARDNKLPLLHSNVVLDSNLNKSIICESCQLGKSKKQPFSASNRTSSSPLQLVHTDI
jgi:hypothetical protein